MPLTPLSDVCRESDEFPLKIGRREALNWGNAPAIRMFSLFLFASRAPSAPRGSAFPQVRGVLPDWALGRSLDVR